MLTIEKSIEIDAPVEAVFAYAADPSHLPEYYTDVREVRDLRQLPNGGYTATLWPLAATIETVELVPNERIVSHGQWGGPFGDVTMTTTFERLDGDKTRVTLHEEHLFHGGFFAKLGEKTTAGYLQRAAELTITALKARIEASVLAPATP